MAAYANGILDKITIEDFIERLIKHERLLGTACGGMDQSICILGR